MKRAYTQYHPLLHSLVKEQNATVEDFLSRMDANPAERDKPWAMLAFFEDCFLKGTAQNIFLPSLDFCEWIVSCVKEFNSDYAILLQKIIKGHIGCFHFPTASGVGSFMSLIVKEKDGPIYLYFVPSKEMKSLPDYMKWTFDEMPLLAKNEAWFCKLVIGIGMYVSCFPETLRDGLPDDLKHPSHHQHKEVFTVGISEKVKLGGTHDSPTPHFRVGHFRVLRSEKFTHKRFQTVFVHETFVRGVAKTVLSPEQADEPVTATRKTR